MWLSWHSGAPMLQPRKPLLTLAAYTFDGCTETLSLRNFSRGFSMQIDSERLSGFSLGSLWSTVNPFGSKGTLVPVLRLTGTIGAVTPLRQGLSIAACANAIERAFSIKGAPAVAIQINSPGGSPVQSRLIYERIRTQATEKSRKVFAF